MRMRLSSRITGIVGLTIAALVFNEHRDSTLTQTKPPEAEIRPFIGTWTAVHAGTPIIVLHLRPEKGELVGDVQVCSYGIDTETKTRMAITTIGNWN